MSLDQCSNFKSLPIVMFSSWKIKFTAKSCEFQDVYETVAYNDNNCDITTALSK